MIPRRPTGTAAFCYGLTAADNLSYPCNQRGIVSVQCTQSTTMVDDNGIPIPIHPAGICNPTRLCCNNCCTIRCRNIQTAVGFCSTGNRAGTSDKAAADSGTPGNRPTQRAVSGIIYLRAAAAALALLLLLRNLIQNGFIRLFICCNHLFIFREIVLIGCNQGFLFVYNFLLLGKLFFCNLTTSSCSALFFSISVFFFSMVFCVFSNSSRISFIVAHDIVYILHTKEQIRKALCIKKDFQIAAGALLLQETHTAAQ